MNYKNKETGVIQNESEIKKEYMELISNSDEFNKYINNFELFISEYYEKVEK